VLVAWRQLSDHLTLFHGAQGLY